MVNSLTNQGNNAHNLSHGQCRHNTVDASGSVLDIVISVNFAQEVSVNKSVSNKAPTFSCKRVIQPQSIKILKNKLEEHLWVCLKPFNILYIFI